METYMKTHRLAWLRLNSDLLLIVMLAFFNVFFDFLNPFRDNIVRVAGFVTPLFILMDVGMLLGALTILYALVRGRIHSEVIGRGLILGAIALDTYRNLSQFGVGDTEFQSALAILLAFLLTSTLRVSALFNKKGIVFQLPPRKGSIEEAEEKGDYDA